MSLSAISNLDWISETSAGDTVSLQVKRCDGSSHVPSAFRFESAVGVRGDGHWVVKFQSDGAETRYNDGDDGDNFANQFSPDNGQGWWAFRDDGVPQAAGVSQT